MGSTCPEERVFEIGAEIIERAKKHRPGRFSGERFENWIFEMCMEEPWVKTQLLRFIDVLPSLKTDEEILRHMEEYLSLSEIRPLFLRLAVAAGTWTSRTLPKAAAAAVKSLARRMANRFIAGGEIRAASEIVARQYQRDGTTFSLDVLGERVTSEEGAARYLESCLRTLDVLAERFGAGAKNGHGTPLINLSVKASSLHPRFDPIDPDGASGAVKDRLRPLLRKAKEIGAFVNIDTERYETKDLTYRIFRELASEKEFRDFPHLGIVVQAYLRDAERSLGGFVQWAKKNRHPITVRLVKGAYWDEEITLAQKNGWRPPVFAEKRQTDANFEALTETLLENSEYTRPAIASHNIRSISHALAAKEERRVRDAHFEIQMLYGMGNEIKKALVEKGVPLRVYTPFGNLIAGMATSCGDCWKTHRTNRS